MSRWELLDEATRLYRVEYTFGSGGSASCMAVGLNDGLLLISPPGGPHGSALLDEVDRLGRVTAALAPCGAHTLGMRHVARRYPKAQLFAPEGVEKKLGKGCPDPSAVRPLSELQAQLPEHLELLIPPHLKRPDTIGRVRTDRGVYWYFNDLILNLEGMPPNPAFKLLFRALGMKPGLRLNPLAWRFILVKDQEAFAVWLEAELRRAPPQLLVMGHGPVVRDPKLLAALPDLVAAGV